MASLQELKKTRLAKAATLKKTGVNPYPLASRRTHSCHQAARDFTSISRQAQEIILVGRLISIRVQGGAGFAHIQDGTGHFQIFFKKDALGEKKYQSFIKYFDIGDFIEARGTLFKTKKREKTLKAVDFKMLAKSLLPLPDKWYGLKDIEERFRKRYLDLLMNSEIKEKFERRSQIIKEIRFFLESQGFLEIETPILQPLPGGATAEPFTTHHQALNLDLYLRIAPELYLKRLLIAGLEKVYEIGRCFRNEGIDKSHNPDFTMLEFYWAHKDYKDLMKFTEKLFEHLIKTIFKSTKIEYGGKKIDFKTPWPRIEFSQLLKKETRIIYEDINRESLIKEAKKLGLKIKDALRKEEVAEEIYKKICLPKIWRPTFIIHQPIALTPLAKALDKEPQKAARFQLAVAGWELVNAFSEQNDPVLQREILKEQDKRRKRGEPKRSDEDFLEALEHGLPPAAGFGLGLDRLAAVLTNSHSVREVILFPTMKPRRK